MIYQVISDIHGNLEALRAVLARKSPGRIVILGDVIGYGPDPRTCIDEVSRLGAPVILGNHEGVQLDLSRLEYFNSLAKDSALYTHGCLTAADLDWIRSLPDELILDGMYFSHGSPYAQERFHYLMPKDYKTPELRLSFAKLERLGIRVAFNGHTHLPGFFNDGSGYPEFTPLTAGTAVTLDRSCRYIINCGSVGQPRNGDCNAQFIRFDSDALTLSLESVPYDIDATAAKMKEAGLPELLWQRLYEGI